MTATHSIVPKRSRGRSAGPVAPSRHRGRRGGGLPAPRGTAHLRDSRFRASSDAIIRGAGMQSGLWPHAISGDLPILSAHRPHRRHRAGPTAIESARILANEASRCRSGDRRRAGLVVCPGVADRDRDAPCAAASRGRVRRSAARGAVYTLRADLMSVDARALLRSVARVELVAARRVRSPSSSRVCRRSSACVAHAAAGDVAASGTPCALSTAARARVFQRSRRIRQERPRIRHGPFAPA